jgi:hypothetical protein
MNQENDPLMVNPVAKQKKMKHRVAKLRIRASAFYVNAVLPKNHPKTR